MGHRRKGLSVLLAIKGNAVFVAMWIAVMVSASAAYAISAGIDWNEAMIVGSTPGNRICYRVGEEIEFTLRLAGVKGEIPPDTYFVDWSRRGEDGVVEDNFIDHPFDLGMKISMSHLWLEGTCGSNVRVARNRIEKDGTGTGIYVGGTPGKKGGTVPADSHRNLVFEDNEILDVLTGIRVTGCTGLSLKGNRVRIASPKGRPTVLENVVDVSGLGEEP